eukprot:9132501-Pyramimonas_sp.AAC.1
MCLPLRRLHPPPRWRCLRPRLSVASPPRATSAPRRADRSPRLIPRRSRLRRSVPPLRQHPVAGRGAHSGSSPRAARPPSSALR